MKIYFFPGLGADSSLAPYHILPGFDARWIEWPKKFGKNWDGFIQEILNENEFESDSIYVGISFGGLVAQKLAEKVKPRKIIYIGSLQSPKSISFLLRVLSPLAFLIPVPLFKIRYAPKFLIRYYFGIHSGSDTSLFFEMAKKINGEKAKTLVGLALTDTAVSLGDVPILIIHGMNDRIIPWKGRDAIGIAGGGHLISMTHHRQVNEAILSRTNDRMNPPGNAGTQN